MTSGFSNGMGPASMWSFSCDSCLAVHDSAAGDGPCPHQRPVFNIPPPNGYTNTVNVSSTDIGVGAGVGAGAGTGAEWVAYTGSFDQHQGIRDWNYLPNIVYDLSPTDENFGSQDQPPNVLNDNSHFAPGGNSVTTSNQNDYSNGHHDADYSNGSSNDSPYHSAQTSWSAGSPSERMAPQARPRVTNSQDYYYSEDDRVITDHPTNRSNLQPFTNKHLRKVRRVIKDADAKLGNRQYYSS